MVHAHYVQREISNALNTNYLIVTMSHFCSYEQGKKTIAQFHEEWNHVTWEILSRWRAINEVQRKNPCLCIDDLSLRRVALGGSYKYGVVNYYNGALTLAAVQILALAPELMCMVVRGPHATATNNRRSLHKTWSLSNSVDAIRTDYARVAARTCYSCGRFAWNGSLTHTHARYKLSRKGNNWVWMKLLLRLC